MGFSRQEYRSGLPFPSPGDLPEPGFKPRSPALQADTLPSEPPGKPHLTTTVTFILQNFIYFFNVQINSTILQTLTSGLADITKMFLVFPKVDIFLSLFQFYTNTKNSPKMSSILNCLPVLISRVLSKWKAKVVTCFLPCFLSNASLGESSLPFNCPSLFSFLLLKWSWQRGWGGM